MYETPRQQVERLWKSMDRERSTWLSGWRDIVRYIVPWRGRFLDWGDQPNDGTPKSSLILDPTASKSVRTGKAGMATSLTNPARPWFRLTTADPGLAALASVRGYLSQVERLVQWIFARSNIHGALTMMYGDALSIATSPLWVDEDPQDVIRGYVLPVGSYALAVDHRQRIDTVGQEVEPTVRQLLRRFGPGRLCRATRKLVEKKQWNQKVRVLHLILPNEDLDLEALDARGKPYLSVWLERTAEENEPFLRVSGYRQFPVMTGRWEVVGTEDVYGYGPGHEALPDVKQLQHATEQKLNLGDAIVQPALNHPAGLRHQYPSALSGALNAVPDQGTAKVEPTYVPHASAWQVASVNCRELQVRIREAFHEDLWRMLADREAMAEGGAPQMTAREVAERHEEKLTLLGPVVDRWHNEVLSPLIRRTISVAAEQDLLPPPPDELVQELARGADVRIEYVSVLALAQRLLGLGSMERFASIVASLAPDRNDPLWDKVDRDEFVDQVSDKLGLPPSVVRPDEVVAEHRLARARRAEQERQAAAVQQAAGTVRDLAQANAGGELSRLLGAYGPAASSALTRGVA